jgi:uncharacterized protein (TIGR02001 family)
MHYVRGASRALALAAVLAISAFVGTARAGDESENGTSNGPSATTNATLTSDYRFRGFTQTQERAALQGGFEVTFHQFYVGLWASNVDYGDVLHAGHWKNVASAEVDTYVGYKHKFWGFQTDVRAIFYSYPGSFGDPNNLNYFEAMFGISRDILPQLTLDFQAYYSPDYIGETGRNWVFEAGLARKFNKHGFVTPSLSARIGWSEGDEKAGGIDYGYWNAGVSFLFADYFEFDIRYFDTFEMPSSVGSCTDRCDGRVVARITFEN